ncbi:MAG TPA: CBS domain-containing protein [Candidatus Eisenbacteria bacterium]
MRIQEVMTGDPEYCTPHHDLAHAAMIMWRRDCGIVPVVEGGTNKLIGVITDRDICLATTMKNRAPSIIAVGDVMNRTPKTCLPDEDVHTALRKMAEAQVRRLPVTDAEGNLRGIVALNDLARHTERPEGEGEGPVLHSSVVGVLRAVSRPRSQTNSTTVR